jgi:hypothetical protein
MNRVLAITTGTRSPLVFEAAALMHPPPDGPPAHHPVKRCVDSLYAVKA